jgi:hypothetical protein
VRIRLREKTERVQLWFVCQEGQYSTGPVKWGFVCQEGQCRIQVPEYRTEKITSLVYVVSDCVTNNCSSAWRKSKEIELSNPEPINYCRVTRIHAKIYSKKINFWNRTLLCILYREKKIQTKEKSRSSMKGYSKGRLNRLYWYRKEEEGTGGGRNPWSRRYGSKAEGSAPPIHTEGPTSKGRRSLQ